MSRPRRATALRHDGRDAPRVVASGRGHVADRILEAAREAGVPLREDPVLLEALATLELEQEIPPELYKAVAEALAWAYRLAGKRKVWLQPDPVQAAVLATARDRATAQRLLRRGQAEARPPLPRWRRLAIEPRLSASFDGVRLKPDP